MNRVRIFCLIFFLFAVVVAMAGNFVWFDGKMPVSYAVSKDCSPIVLTAIEMWKDDMLQVSGKIPFNSLGGSKSTVRIVQLGEESSDELTELGVPIGDLSANKEAFWIGIVRNQLLVVGSDPRGTVYGVLELSRLAGVSPWVWWGDVTPERKMELTLPTDFQTFQHPSVEFRGIFINDEDWSSMPWANENFAYKLTDSLQLSSGKRWKGAIGPKAYEKLFQLLLRLRANTVWPAMHECSVPFYFVEGNRQMAEKYGVTVGTSHCEPLMCNAASEWDVRGKDDYNYITNKHAVIDFWTERLEELKNSENIFTVGMRGKHDGSMEG
ncbi:MAG: glycosyl hydrolase 115 family protein, partial [Bacteroidales bacterium]|nr:glycosyl hydrolase 115 family protein [Bacteroidales bacterium]